MQVAVQAVECRQLLNANRRHLETHSVYLRGALSAMRRLAMPACSAALIAYDVADVEIKKL